MEEVASELSHFQKYWVDKGSFHKSMQSCSVRTAHVIRCPLLPGSLSSNTNWSPTLHCAPSLNHSIAECANAASVDRVRSFLQCRSQSSAVWCDAAMSHPSLRIEQEIGCEATRSLLNASLGVWAASPLLLQQRY